MRESVHLLLSIAAPSDLEERGRRFRELLSVGARPEDFSGDEFTEALFERMMADFMNSRGIPALDPLLTAVEAETGLRPPMVSVSADDPSFSYWLEGFRETRIRSLLFHYGSLLREMAVTGVVSDSQELIRELGQELGVLSTQRKPSALHPLLEEVIDRHEKLRMGAYETGIELGFPFVDRLTGGAQNGDLVVLIGMSGTGKTYLLCRSAEHAAKTLGKRVLFVTMEMTGFQIARRIAAIGASVNPSKLRLGMLDVFALDKVRDYVQTWKGRDDEEFLFIEGKVGTGISEIAVYVQEYRPDVVYIDGLYMIKPASGTKDLKRWEIVLNAVEELKQLALGENIPIIATTQYSRKGAKEGMEGVGYSYAIAQAASVGISIENFEGAQGRSLGDFEYKVLRIIKNREGELGAVRLKYDLRRAIIAEDQVLEGTDPMREEEGKNWDEGLL